MSNCENLEKCAFFAEYQRNEKKRLALRGFATMYCQGDRQTECIRKAICNRLGGPSAVPVNMMPNGKPLPGTTNTSWQDRIFKELDLLHVTYYMRRDRGPRTPQESIYH